MSQVLESLQLLLPLGFDLMSCDLFRKCIYASKRILFWSLVLLLLIQCSAGMTISYMLNDYMVDPSRSALETGSRSLKAQAAFAMVPLGTPRRRPMRHAARFWGHVAFAVAQSAWIWPWRPNEALEVRDLLVKSKTLGPREEQNLKEKLQRLAEAKVPCRAELLGNSTEELWRSVYIQGKTPKWEQNARVFRPWVRNKAGQAYDTRSGRVRNYGELLGPGLHFVAEGRFDAVDETNDCPKEFRVEIEQGGLVILGFPLLSSLISGPGLVRVLYLDEDIRLFESPNESPGGWEERGLRVVQVRDDLFGD